MSDLLQQVHAAEEGLEAGVAVGWSPAQLSQLGVLSLGFLKDGDFGVSVFPQREEILVGAALAAYCMSFSRWQQAEEIEEARRKCSEQLPWAAELRGNFCVGRYNLAYSPVFSLAFQRQQV